MTKIPEIKKGFLSWEKSAWLSIPFLAATMIVLWVADVPVVYESRSLMLLLNLIFTGMVAVFIVTLAGRSFLISGESGLIMLGCGALFWGAASMAAFFFLHGSDNTIITIHNIGVLAAALCSIGGLAWHRRLRQPLRWLSAGYAVALMVVALIVWAATTGKTPVFFVQGQGGTPIRYIMLSLTVTLFGVTAWLMLNIHRHHPSAFLHYYGLGLMLLALGLAGIMLESVHGGLLSWAARIAQYLGGAYLFFAMMAARRETGTLRISLDAVEEAWKKGGLLSVIRDQPFSLLVLRYALAVVMVAAAMGLRVMLEAWSGPGLPTFITFFPAIMVVALLAGSGPGFLATVLTCVTVAYLILPPAEQFYNVALVDRLGLVIFLILGLSMTALAGLYRRYQIKVAAYERELALLESEKKLANIYASMLEGLAVHELVYGPSGKAIDYIITEVNPAFEKITGLARGQAIGQKASVLYGTGEAPYLDVFSRVALTGNPESFEVYFQPMDKNLSISVFSPGAGKFATVFQDITERKRAEEALRESEARLRLAQSSAGAGVWDWEIPSGRLKWSEELFHLFGMHPERDSANFGSWKSALHPEDRRMAEKLIETAIEKRIPLDSEYRVVLPSREVRWIKCLGNTVYDHDYQPLRMSGICLDITERKRAEEVLKRDKETFEKLVQEKMLELINARTELERARRLSDIGTLASTVAHELRNPLATIGLAALNIKKKAKNPDIEKHLNNIDAKIAESDQIINNLLFYARIKPSQFEKVDIFRLVEESAETARGNNKKKIALRKRLASIKDVAIEADRVQLAEVFSNVLNNAFDAVVDKTGKIEISAAQDKEAIEVRVGDNGCGINEDDLARIFDPFFTTKARGTGLGLSVCRQIMDFHRGTIRVESKPGQGTTVIVRLPKTHAA